MKSPILEQIADGLNKLGRRGSTLLKDFIEVEYMDLSDEEVPVGLEEPGLHEVAGFGSLVLELPTPPREEPRPEVGGSLIVTCTGLLDVKCFCLGDTGIFI